jgi:hypothetical protein
MIIVVTYKNPKSGLIYVSHGVEVETDHHVPLPNVPLQDLKIIGLKFDQEIGEYTIP